MNSRSVLLVANLPRWATANDIQAGVGKGTQEELVIQGTHRSNSVSEQVPETVEQGQLPLEAESREGANSIDTVEASLVVDVNVAKEEEEVKEDETLWPDTPNYMVDAGDQDDGITAKLERKVSSRVSLHTDVRAVFA